ncbi:uncharacterized protein V6R79_017113 [Siganus canaliculatus]
MWTLCGGHCEKSYLKLIALSTSAPPAMGFSVISSTIPSSINDYIVYTDIHYKTSHTTREALKEENWGNSSRSSSLTMSHILRSKDIR